jgi:hypothetical protein
MEVMDGVLTHLLREAVETKRDKVFLSDLYPQPTFTEEERRQLPGVSEYIVDRRKSAI